MNKILFVLGYIFLLACLNVASAQTVCTPRLGGGFDCHDYDTGTSSTITPLGYHTYGIGSYGEVTSDRAYKADDHGKDSFGEPPEVGGGYYTYDYGTGESGIITPRLGGGFQIDRY